jgi:hypothetical protein
MRKMGEVIVTGLLTLFVVASVCQGLAYLYDLWYFRNETRKEEEGVPCECRTPKRGNRSFGITFVCDNCARKWYYTHDNIAWAGWAWAPFWKRQQIRLGWDRRVYEDPPEKTELAKKLEKESRLTALSWILGARERESR